MSEWYVAQNGVRTGPLSLEELRSRLASGAVRPTDLVWNESMSDWRPAGTVPELQGGTPAALRAMPLGYEARGSGPIEATERAIDMLRQTRPWVRFLSILMFIGTGLLLLMIVIMILAGRSRGGGVTVAGQTLIILLSVLFYLPPAIYLNRYAGRLADLMHYRRAMDLEAALSAQKSFWKFMGILTLVIIILYALIFVVAMIAAATR